MFVSLGFLCALLLGFVVAPAFWSRAVRLTTERMRASLPLTEQEIKADRDRLRAESAIRVHQLTAKIEQARLYDARQKVEINRRDGTISSLERRLQLIETEREGSENARRVLGPGNRDDCKVQLFSDTLSCQVSCTQRVAQLLAHDRLHGWACKNHTTPGWTAELQ